MASPVLRTGEAISATTGELDLSLVGQNGLDFDLNAIANSTPYTKNPLHIKLTRAPKAYRLHPQGERLTVALKHLIEKHPQSWEGFSQVLEIETAQVAVGWDRQMLTIPTNITRGPITPSLTATRLYDETDAKFWNYHIDTFMGNATIARPNYAELSSVPADWLVDQYTFDIIAFEPDATYTRAIKAWACACMLPTNSIEITGVFDTQNAHATEEYTLTFATVYDGGQNIKDVATAMLQAMNIHSINPIHKPAYFDVVDPNVDDADGILAQHVAASETWVAP